MKLLTVWFSIISIALITSCTPVKIAFDDSTWNEVTELPVNGRQGFLFKQKLSFGSFTTTSVKRSWTKGSGWSYGTSLNNDWLNRISVDYMNRKQTLRFTLTDSLGNESEVTALSRVEWRNLIFGNNPNDLINIIGDILGIGDARCNTYTVRIFANKNEPAWEMCLNNDAAQQNATTYFGVLAQSRENYYKLMPVYRLKKKNEGSVALPFGGSVGYEFKNKNNETVAAVSLIDKGMVYLKPMEAKEKFLLANAIAAILLQQAIDEQS